MKNSNFGNDSSDESVLLVREREWLMREKYGGVESEAFHADCARLATGEPLGYVIGHVPFLNCTIWLDSHPLIPRPETEYWVEQAIKAISNTTPSSDLQILDLCAGSGAIGVTIAKACPGTHVTFTELDPAHLPTIKKNLKENNIELEKSTLSESDLFEHIPTEQTFDFILTNPPYIDKEADTVTESVTAHEPHLALFGGRDGMEVIERIIAGARAKLAPPTPNHPTGGQLWIEHEPFQINALQKLAFAYDFHLVTHPDQYETPRFSVLTVAK